MHAYTCQQTQPLIVTHLTFTFTFKDLYFASICLQQQNIIFAIISQQYYNTQIVFSSIFVLNGFYKRNNLHIVTHMHRMLQTIFINVAFTYLNK